MTLPAEPVLSQEELGELRHDLRTPFNAIIGYTEMLLEVVADDGLDAFAPGLQQIHTSGRELLAVVSNALAAGATVRSDALWNLGGEMAARLDPLAGQIESLLVQARQTGADSLLPDLDRIRDAAAQLMHLTGDRLRMERRDRPAAREAPERPAGASTSEGPSIPQGAEPRARAWGNLLVVDDVDLNRDVLVRRLEREGYQAQTAKGGREALEMLEADHFDLVLLDILMPDVDGYEVLHQIKARPTLRDIPVIMISALDELRSVVRCIEMGAEDYLPKPFDPILLRARVGACLEKKRLRDKELEYLQGVAAVQAAATAVESGAFRADELAAVAARNDELGTLARVFQRMASEVQAREERLKNQLTQLQIEIDETRKARHVEEITSGGFFQDLRGRADKLRAVWEEWVKRVDVRPPTINHG